MDKKNTFLGTFFVLAAVAAYYYSVKHTPPRPDPASVQAASAALPSQPSAVAAGGSLAASTTAFAAATSDQAGAQDTALENSFIRASFTDFGGAVRDVAFNKYPLELHSPAPAVFNGLHKDPMLAFVGFPGLDRSAHYQLISKSASEIVYRTVLDGRLEVTRRYVMPPDQVGTTDPYQLRVETAFRNLTDKSVEPLSVALAVGTAAPVSDRDTGIQLTTGYHHDTTQAFMRRGSLEGSGGFLGLGFGAHSPTASVESPGPMDWAAVNNQFFSSVLTPDPVDEAVQQAWVEKRTGELVTQGQSKEAAQAAAAAEYTAQFSTAKIAALVTRRVKLYPQRPDSDNSAYGITADAQFVLPAIPARGTVMLNGNLYVGPKEYHRLSNADVFKANQERVVLQNGAFLRFFSALLLTLMTWMHSWTANWGVAIVLTTLTLKIVFLPFTLAASRSARRMQKIQPEMKAIKEKFKDNPQKQQAATMELFKAHKVNPVGGCLPMLITLPFFWGFFGMLSNVAELRFAPFLWAHDLSAPDTIGHLFGFPINLLALLLGVTMYLQMQFTPQPSVDNSQAAMMKFTPLIFMLICYAYPCALALYSTTNALFSIGQQIVVNRLQDNAVPEPTKGPSGKLTRNVTPHRRK